MVISLNYLNEKKRILISSIVLVIGAIILLFIAKGFIKRTDVYLADYNVSEDGAVIIMNIGITSPLGYSRDCKIKNGGEYRKL